MDATRAGDDPDLHPRVIAWIERAVVPDGHVTAAVSLSQSGAGGPWRLELEGSVVRSVALKVGDASQPHVRGRFATEAAALEIAGRHGVAAPRLIAADPDGVQAGAAVLVCSVLPGSSRIARDVNADRLRALGAAAASIHRARVRPSEALPLRERSLQGAFPADDLSGASGALFRRAQARLDALDPPPEPRGLVHGDLWHGNTMWTGQVYAGALDWDFAGVGPAGIDLGSLRCDAAVMYGLEAPDEVLAGWENAQGTPATNRAWWDVISALASPSDLGVWLPNFHAQGRTDLTIELVTHRRDAFLAAALDDL